jgi:type VI protein secretion system component VasK
VGRSVGKAQLPEHAATSVIRDDAPSVPPVFVDPSGARRRRVRRAAYAAGVLLVLVLVVVWATQFSGPASPPARTPCPSACGR